MILPLRRAHRSAFVALAVLLPVLLASAWKVRRDPVLGELSDELLPALPTARTPYGHLGGEELVYWVPEGIEDWTELPEDAELVGTVRAGAQERTPPPGKQIMLYSLPHRLVGPTLKDLSRSPAKVREAR